MNGKYFLWVVFILFMVAFVFGILSLTFNGAVISIVAFGWNVMVYWMMRQYGKVEVREL